MSVVPAEASSIRYLNQSTGVFQLIYPEQMLTGYYYDYYHCTLLT